MIDTEYLDITLQDIYQRLMVDADDVGMAYDEVLQYVEQFEMDEDMLFSFIKEKIEETKERKKMEKGRMMMESLKRSLRDPLS
jgi:hypothetical protein|tara:strand:+ start:2651 stop:2899 length:249 start_codon:yes stop_codon:yes gene_type:complete